jgi:hypothetical protein
MNGQWDGGYAIETDGPIMTQKLAQMLNHLCLQGALGSHRARLEIRHDYTRSEQSRRHEGNGQRPRK